MSITIGVVAVLLVATIFGRQTSLIVATSTTVGNDGLPRETARNAIDDVTTTMNVAGSEWASTSPYDDVTGQSPSTQEIQLESFWQYRRAKAIMQYALPVLLAFTTIDNVLAVVVLQHPTFRGSSTGFILSALAITDMLVVYTGLMRLWVVFYFGFDFQTMSNSGCKFHVFFTYFTRQV